jgi:hypothetical protein
MALGLHSCCQANFAGQQIQPIQSNQMVVQLGMGDVQGVGAFEIRTAVGTGCAQAKGGVGIGTVFAPDPIELCARKDGGGEEKGSREMARFDFDQRGVYVGVWVSKQERGQRNGRDGGGEGGGGGQRSAGGHQCRGRPR